MTRDKKKSRFLHGEENELRPRELEAERAKQSQSGGDVSRLQKKTPAFCSATFGASSYFQSYLLDELLMYA